ncbi:glycosyltransferase family 4 protein [Clostridium perfringens]
MDNKIRVLIIGSDLSVKGGITSVIKSFLESNLTDVEFKLLPTYVEGNSFRKIIFYIKGIIKYLKAIFRKEFDIAHVHMSYKGSFFRKLLIIKISNLFGVKSILHLHGSEFEVFYESSCSIVKKLIRNIFDSSDYVIVLGEKWREIISTISSNNNIIVFNNAINIPKLKSCWNDENINILFLGVIIKRKGIYELIDAIKILNDEGFIKQKNLRFFIGGTGPEENGLKKLIKCYKLEENINMVGWVDGKLKKDLLMNSQLFVLPSYNEGLPVAILEAMSYGVPVVATDVGSISEVVIDNCTGILIKEPNGKVISKAIKQLVENKKVWEEYSDSCKKIINEKFNDKEYFRKFYDLYFELNNK